MELVNHACFGGKTCHCKGADILINSKFGCDIIHYENVLCGAFEIKFGERQITKLNIYIPNKDDTFLF